MFCKPQARVLLVSSGTHSTCCCSLPRVTQDSLFAHSKTPLWRSRCNRNTYLTDMHAQLLCHTCSPSRKQCSSSATCASMYTMCHRRLLVADSTTKPESGSCMSRSAAAQHAALSRGNCIPSSIFCPAYLSERSDPKASYLSHSAPRCFLLVVWKYHVAVPT